MYALLLLLSGAVVTDLMKERVPNTLILLGLLSGLLYQSLNHGISGIWDAMLGAGLTLVLLFPVFCMGGFGAGDVKLLCVTGCFLGPVPNLKCLALSIVFGAVISIGKMLYSHNFRKRFCIFFQFIRMALIQKSFRAFEEYRFERTSDGIIHFTIPILVGVVSFIIITRGETL